MLLYMFGSVRCSFIAFPNLQELVFVATPMACQQFKHSLNLFGDCEVYGVWPTKSFHPILLWLCVFFTRAFSAHDV